MSAAVRDDGCGVVDRADLRHPLASALLTAGQPGLGASGPARGLRRGRLGGAALGAHHDPLAVDRERPTDHPRLGQGRQAGPGRSPRNRPRRVRASSSTWRLPSRCPVWPLDRATRVLEAAARCLRRGQLAQPEAVALNGQVQRRVSGMQVPRSGAPVGHPLDRHRRRTPSPAPADDRARSAHGSPRHRRQPRSRRARGRRVARDDLQAAAADSSRPSRSRRSSARRGAALLKGPS